MIAWQDALFTPRRVAVVGASATPSKAGALFLRNLTAVESGYGGEVVGIHPSAREVLGFPAFPNLAAVAEPVDLAVVVTPSEAVAEVVADCGTAKVPVAIIISGGFAETGPRAWNSQLARGAIQPLDRLLWLALAACGSRH